MNRTTTLALFLLVLVLGGLVWWQTGREERGDFDYVERLFEGVDPRRVTALRIDGIERGVHVTLERDAARTWAITDPIAYPARRSVVDALLEIVGKNRVARVPRDDLDLALAGFDPPRAVLDVIESLDGEGTRSTRVELGAPDLDGNRVHVRVRGGIFRTVRNLDTLLEQSVDDYRDQNVFRMAPEDVVRVARRSRVPLPDVGVLEQGDGVESGGATSNHGLLQAHRQQFRWWIDHPVRGQADPALFGLLLTHMCSLRVDRFVDDAPEVLAWYGLQSPRFEIELESRDGVTQTLLIGHADGSTYAKRADLPWVWGLEPSNVMRLYLPAEDLLDHSLVRILRSEVSSIEIENGTERVIVERVVDTSRRALGSREKADWTVRAEPLDPGGSPTAGTAPLPANAEKVDEILSQLEHVEVLRYLDPSEVDEPFAGTEPLGIWLQLREERQGGRVGRPFSTEGGARARTFRRDGESETCLVPKEIAELLTEATLLELRSLALFDTDEVHLRRLVLRHAGDERAYFRAIEGTWRHKDLEEAVATELFPVLDGLFFLRAKEHLAPTDDGALEQPVEVEIVDVEGQRTVVVLGQSDEHGPVAEIGGQRSRLENQDLHGLLVGLFE